MGVSFNNLEDTIPVIPGRGVPWRKVWTLITFAGLGTGTAIGTGAWGVIEKENKDNVLVQLSEKENELSENKNRLTKKEEDNEKLKKDLSETKEQNKDFNEKITKIKDELEETKGSLQKARNEELKWRKEQIKIVLENYGNRKFTVKI